MIMYSFNITADIVTDILSEPVSSRPLFKYLSYLVSRLHTYRPALAHSSLGPPKAFHWCCALPQYSDGLHQPRPRFIC